MLKIGDIAPQFDVKSSKGTTVRLADYAGKKNVVLFFYPKDFTKVCTAEVCGFRDMYEGLVAKDTEVIGVSLDDADSHERFAAQHRVPYPLVADTGKTLARAYGAVGPLRGILGVTKRITFVIDKRGLVAGVFEGDFSAGKHLEGVKGTLVRLAS